MPWAPMKMGNQVQKFWKSIHRNRSYSIFGHNGIPMIWLENENCSNFGQDEAIFKIFVSNSTNLAMPDPFLASTVHFDDLFFIRQKSEKCPKFDGPILILTMNWPTYFFFLVKLEDIWKLLNDFQKNFIHGLFHNMQSKMTIFLRFALQRIKKYLEPKFYHFYL